MIGNYVEHAGPCHRLPDGRLKVTREVSIKEIKEGEMEEALRLFGERTKVLAGYVRHSSRWNISPDGSEITGECVDCEATPPKLVEVGNGG